MLTPKEQILTFKLFKKQRGRPRCFLTQILLLLMAFALRTAAVLGAIAGLAIGSAVAIKASLLAGAQWFY